jgi:hypothetical protein
MVRRGASLHADKARRQNFEELHQLAATELLSDNDILSRVDAVNLENVLGDIQSDRGNLHVDGSPDVIRSQRPPYGSSLLGAGAVHHINFSREPPFLLRELSYMRELPPKRADSPQERIGGVDGGGC